MDKRTTIRLVLFALSMGAVSCAGNEGSARPRIIDERPVCVGCEIRLRAVALLGDSSDDTAPLPNAAGRECMVGRLSTGEYAVSGLVGGGRINVYDAKGTLTRRIGRPGAGPGDLGAIVRLVVGPGDTLFVMDDANLRVQVLTAAGVYVRSFPSPGRYRGFALLSDGQLLLHSTSARRTDPLFHLLDRNGIEKERFGVATGAALDLETWIASPAVDGGFWTASVWKYEAFHFRAPGSLVKAVERRADWFPPNGVYPAEGVFLTALAPPGLIHMWEDSARRLWTYSLVADPKWRGGVRQKPSPEWYRSTFDTVIEVIDLKQRRLIARGRYDGRISMVCGSSLMYTVVETPDGDTHIQVLQPEVVVPAGRGRT